MSRNWHWTHYRRSGSSIDKALDTENDAIEYARNKSLKYTPELLHNGDTLKQLLARSRYLLYKSISRIQFRGVRNVDFFLFRLTTIFA